MAVIEFNDVFRPVFESRHRYKILLGSASAGKSFFWAQCALLQFVTIKGFNMLMLRKIGESIGMSVFNLLQLNISLMGLSNRISTNKTEHSFLCTDNNNMICSGGMFDAKQREKVKSAVAINGPFTCIWMEEASEFTQDDFGQADIRLRGELDPVAVAQGLHKQVVLSFNPVRIDHWIKKEFKLEMSDGGITTGRDDTLAIKATVNDNAWATDEDVQILKNLEHTNPLYYQIYYLGNWGVIDEDNVIIPYKLLWEHRNFKIVDPVGQYDIGVDPAREGNDKAVIYMRKGNKKIDKVTFSKSDGFDLADAVQGLITKHRKDETLQVRVKVDAGGCGTSCCDILNKRKAQGQAESASFWKSIKIYEINFGSTAKRPDLYENKVTEMYFEARDLIPVIDFGFFVDEERLVTDITRRRSAVKDKKNNTVHLIETKKAFKKRNNGESPDDGDAFVLCLYDPPEPRTPKLSFIGGQ